MSDTTTPSLPSDPFPGVSHLPTRQGTDFPGAVAQDIAGNRGELPVYDPGPLAPDAWFPSANAVLAAPAVAPPTPVQDTGPRYSEDWFPGIPIRPATDA